MKDFEYIRPTNYGEVCSLLAEYGETAKIIAGGQSLLIMLKEGFIAPDYLIDVKWLPDLDYIKFDGSGLSIGSLATHRSVEQSPIVKRNYPVLYDAETRLASIQIRNYGTVGGNLCHADPASDLASPLIALGAKLKLGSSNSERIVSLENFFINYYETILKPDEMLLEIQVPLISPYSLAEYSKFALRETDGGIVVIAVKIDFDPGKKECEDAKIVVGGVTSTPKRTTQAESALKGEKLSEKLALEIGLMACEEIETFSDMHATEDFKKEIIRVLIKKLINKIGKQINLSSK